jgi:hypothetical protein
VKPHSVSHIVLSLTEEVGANDAFITARVVPNGRRGNIVLGRTLNDGEQDSGESIKYYPYKGESLHFERGSVKIRLQDIDCQSLPAPDGYANVSNTIWTWLNFGISPDQNFFRYFLAAARRLDIAHNLCHDVLSALTDRPELFIPARNRLFGALASAELMVVALGRTMDMLRAIPRHFSISVVVPTAITAIEPTLRNIRNAFEHIEDRAFGNVHGTPHPDALSIFDQRQLLSSGILTYASYSLDLGSEVLPLLIEARQFVIDVAIAIAGGDARTCDFPITYSSALPGTFERIQERAYLLWDSRKGSHWWDAEANWLEAERIDAANTREAG